MPSAAEIHSVAHNPQNSRNSFFFLIHECTRNLVQTRAESSLLELCRVQPRFMNVSHNTHEWIEDVARCSPLHLFVIYRILSLESELSDDKTLQMTETLCNNISRPVFNQRAKGSYNFCVHLCFSVRDQFLHF